MKIVSTNRVDFLGILQREIHTFSVFNSFLERCMARGSAEHLEILGILEILEPITRNPRSSRHVLENTSIWHLEVLEILEVLDLF